MKTFVKISRPYRESPGFFVKAVAGQRGANEPPRTSLPLLSLPLTSLVSRRREKQQHGFNKPTSPDRPCCSRHPARLNVRFNGRNPATHVWEEGAEPPLQPEQRAELQSWL